MKGEVLCDLGVSVGPDKTEVGCAGWTIPGGFDEGERRCQGQGTILELAVPVGLLLSPLRPRRDRGQ